ncbi:hypothetical protein ACHAWF_007850 [Thalassiosira exigua]
MRVTVKSELKPGSKIDHTHFKQLQVAGNNQLGVEYIRTVWIIDLYHRSREIIIFGSRTKKDAVKN